MPPSSGVPRPHPKLKTSKTSSTASTPGPMPPFSGVPLSIPQKLLKHPRLHPLRTDASILWRPSSTSTSQNLKNILDCIHLRTDASILWRPSSTSTPTKTQQHPQLHPLRTDATFLWRPSSTSNTENRLQKNLPHRHETPIFSFSGLPKKNKIYYTY